MHGENLKSRQTASTVQYKPNLYGQFGLVLVFKWFTRVMWWQDRKCNTPSSTDIRHHAVCYQKTIFPEPLFRSEIHVQRSERKPYERRLANNCYRNIKYPAEFLVLVPESEKFCVLDSQPSELYLVLLLYEMALTNHLHYKAYCVGMWCHAGGRSLPNVEWNLLLPSVRSSFHWNVSKFLPNCMASHCTRQQTSNLTVFNMMSLART